MRQNEASPRHEPWRKGWQVSVVLALALSALLFGAGPSHADDAPPIETETYQDDVRLVTFESLVDTHQLTGTSSSVDQPFANDPYIAWREITSAMGGSQVWEVWRCQGPGAANSFTTTEAVDSFSGFVADYFGAVSRGDYSPNFTPKGTYDITADPYYNYACLGSSTTPGHDGGLADDRGLLAFHEESSSGLGGPGTIRFSNQSSIQRLPGTQSAVFGIGGKGTLPHALQSFGDLLVHEVGHTLGWPHVPVKGDDNPYGNPTDLMSGGGLVYVDGEPHLGATAPISLYASGWIDRTEVQEWHSGSTKLRIGTPTSQRTKMVIVPTEERGVFYTVSPLPLVGDSSDPFGVAVHYVDQTTAGGSGGGGLCFEGTCFLVTARVELVPPVGWSPGSAPLLQPGDALTIGSWTLEVDQSHADGHTVTLTGEAPGAPAPVEAPESEPRFDDVPDSHTFSGAIERLAEAGVTQGCNPDQGNTNYCPSSYVTRGQMAAFLVRALQLPQYTGPDRFNDDNGHTFESAIERLAQAGITQGCNPDQGNTNYCPNSYVTRGQMAAFLVRAGLTD